MGIAWLHRIIGSVATADSETFIHRCDEHRDYLAGRQVYSGDLLKIWYCGQWTPARYHLDSLGTPQLILGGNRAIGLDTNPRVRWPDFWDDAAPARVA